jgi:hypothetical protein
VRVGSDVITCQITPEKYHYGRKYRFGKIKLMKRTGFCVVKPCTSEKTWRFGGTCRLHAGSKSKPSKKSAEAGGKLSYQSPSGSKDGN